jgi:septal ring factor EnvC (AmiA/AmiB activator)
VGERKLKQFIRTWFGRTPSRIAAEPEAPGSIASESSTDVTADTQPVMREISSDPVPIESTTSSGAATTLETGLAEPHTLPVRQRLGLLEAGMESLRRETEALQQTDQRTRQELTDNAQRLDALSKSHTHLDRDTGGKLRQLLDIHHAKLAALLDADPDRARHLTDIRTLLVEHHQMLVEQQRLLAELREQSQATTSTLSAQAETLRDERQQIEQLRKQLESLTMNVTRLGSVTFSAAQAMERTRDTFAELDERRTRDASRKLGGVLVAVVSLMLIIAAVVIIFR